VTIKAQTFLDFGTLTCFVDKELVPQYKLNIMEKNTQTPIEVISGQSLSSGPITHETKPLNVTIGSHTNKVVFNVISSLRNPIIIGLSWLVLHNPRIGWHTRSCYFETPQHKAMECETFVRNMQNLK
jgi:hypothetical protein